MQAQSQDLLVILDRKDCKALMGFKDLSVIQVVPARKEFKEFKDLLVILEVLVRAAARQLMIHRLQALQRPGVRINYIQRLGILMLHFKQYKEFNNDNC